MITYVLLVQNLLRLFICHNRLLNLMSLTKTVGVIYGSLYRKYRSSTFTSLFYKYLRDDFLFGEYQNKLSPTGKEVIQG